ncbi:hypothetical protein ABPG74_002414 [Tetrahymena malaccensis]
MSSNAGKIIKIVNICSSLVLAVAGVWRIVSLQVFKVLDTWYFFDFFMPFFMIILGIMLLVIEFKRDFMEKYFLFLTTLLGRGIFNIFLSSMSVFAIGDEFGTLLAPFIYSLILFVIGFFYILFSFFSKSEHDEVKEGKAMARNLILLFAINFLAFFKISNTYDVRFIADHEYSSNTQSTESYIDNYHKIPISQILDTQSPTKSFTITGKFEATGSSNTPSLMFIRSSLDTSTYFMAVSFNLNSNPYKVKISESSSGIINKLTFSYPDYYNCGLHEIAISFYLVDPSSYSISFILRNCKSSQLIQTFTQPTQIDLSDLSIFNLYLSSYQITPQYLYQGTIFKVFCLRNQFVDFTQDSELSFFVLQISEQAQEFISFFDQSAITSSKICVIDESYFQKGCFYAQSQNNYPKKQYGAGEVYFYQAQSYYFAMDIQKYFNYYQLNNLPLSMTLSFWFHLGAVSTNNVCYKSIIIGLNIGNQQFLNICYTYVNDNQYNLNIMQSQNTYQINSYSLNVKQTYFIVFSFYKFAKNQMQILYYGNNQLLYYQVLLLQNSYFNMIFSQPLLINFGDVLYSIANFYKISQFKMTLSSSIIYTPSKASTIIANCEILIYVRNQYQCLLCQQNYFLFQNSCVLQCDSNKYNQISEYRFCVPKCSYKCNSCNPNTPEICLECSSSDRDISINCLCKFGYDDLKSSNCQQYQYIDTAFVVDHYYDTISNNNWQITQQFNKGYTQTPFMILSITKFACNNADYKAVTILSSQITQTSYSVQLTGSTFVSGSSQNTNFHLQVTVLPNNGQFYSEVISKNLSGSSQFNQQINIGSYNQKKYGDYQVLFFISGIQLDNSQATTSFDLQSIITLSDDKTSFNVVTNSVVQYLQITYLVCPSSMPSISENNLFTQNPGIYLDPTGKHYQKTYISNNSLTGFMASADSLRVQALVGLTSIYSTHLKSSLLFDYEIIPRGNPSQQQTRFSMKMSQIYQYHGNILYLAQPYDKSDNCQTRNFYTLDCLLCKSPLLNLNQQCNTSRVTLKIKLSINFLLLTISFPYSINTIQYNGPNQSNNLCQFLFDSTTNSLIGQLALCQMQSQSILISLNNDATIQKGDTITFNQVLEYSDYQALITQISGNTVDQDPLPIPGVILQYQPVINQCDDLFITIKQFLNTQNKGVSTFSWNLDSINPSIQDISTNIQQIITNANNLQTPTLYMPLTLFIQQVEFQLTLQYQYNIRTTSYQTINVKVLGQAQVKIQGQQLVEGPYYVKDQIEIYFSIKIILCSQDQTQFVDREQTIDVTVTEQTLGLNNQLSIQQNRAFSQIFQPYSLKANVQYNFQIAYQTSGGLSGTYSYQLILDQTPLVININGGNRVQDYGSNLTLTSDVKDLDLDPTLAQNQNTQLAWSCLDISTQNICKDIGGNAIQIPQNSQNITFNQFTFIPYSNIQFTLLGTKDTRTSSSQIIISFVDNSIPSSTVSFNDDVLIKDTINWNDVIEATIQYDSTQNVNLLYFGGAIIYQKQVVAYMQFEYGKVRFQLWNYFSSFIPSINDVVLRFSVYNPQYYIPSQSLFQFKLNFPPLNCNLSISPTTGSSIKTIFSLAFSGCKTNNMPISYQFFYYTSEDMYKLEIKSPLLIQRKQITDLTYNAVASTYLPPGNIFILVQAIDSLGAIYNSTNTVIVQQSTFDQDSYIQAVNTMISFSQNVTKLNQILTLSLLSEDIIARPAYQQAIQQQIFQIYGLLIQLSINEYQSSTFQTLATQQLAKLAQNNLSEGDEVSLQSTIGYINQILINVQSYLSQNKKVQYLQDFYNQQIYNTFNLLDQNVNMIKNDNQLEQAIISLSQQIGDLLNLDALPNENPKQYVGSSLFVVSQLITSRNLPYYLDQSISQSTWQSNINKGPQFQETLNQVYQVSYKQYNRNVYIDEVPFQNFIKSVQKNQTNYTINNYTVINPSIKKIQNQQQNIQLPNTVKFTFTPIKNENLTCINRNNTEWTTQGCKTVFNNKTNNYDCICDNLNPVTVANDLISIFTENKNLETVFSEDGIKSIEKFNHFYEYLSVWVLAFTTFLFIGLILYGRSIDKLSKSVIPIVQLQDFNQFQAQNKNELDQDDFNLNNQNNQQKLNNEKKSQSIQDNEQTSQKEIQLKQKEIENQESIKINNQIQTQNQQKLDEENLLLSNTHSYQKQKQSSCSINQEQSKNSPYLEQQPTIKTLDIFQQKNSLKLDSNDEQNLSNNQQNQEEKNSKSQNKIEEQMKIEDIGFHSENKVNGQIQQQTFSFQSLKRNSKFLRFQSQSRGDSFIQQLKNQKSIPEYNLENEFFEAQNKNKTQQNINQEEEEEKNQNEQETENKISQKEQMQVKTSRQYSPHSIKISQDFQQKKQFSSEAVIESKRQSILYNENHSELKTEALITQTDRLITQGFDKQLKEQVITEQNEEQTEKKFIKNSLKKQDSIISIENDQTYVEIQKQQKKKKLLSMDLLSSSLYFHDLFSIFIIYDAELSRPARFFIQFAKILHAFDSQIIFSYSYTFFQVIIIQIFNLILISLISKLIEYGFSKKGCIQIIIKLFIYSLIGFYYYAFVSIVSSKQPSDTNIVSLQFLLVLAITTLFTDILLAIFCRFIGIKLLNKKDMKGFYIKIYDIIKLQLILENL